MKPVNIIFVSDKKDTFSKIEKELTKHQQFTISHVKTGEQVKQHIQEKTVDVAIVAEQLEEKAGFECIQEIVKLNPFINCVLSSPLSHDDFHEVTEGYGVLMQFSPIPTINECTAFLKKLTKIYQLAGETL